MKKRVLAILLAISILTTIMPAQHFTNKVNAESRSLTDISDHWAAGKINELLSKGIITGYSDNTFRPNKTITRAEFCAIINKVFGYTQASNDAFNDIKSGDWFYTDVLKAKEAGIINGYNNNFFPGKPITRQDAAVILYKVFELTNINDTKASSYKDFGNVSQYARNAVEVLLDKSYMSGFPDKTIRPKNNITRAEAAILVNKLSGTIINTTGEFSMNKVEGNVVINVPGVTLKNTKVSGDLYLTEGISEGEVLIDNVMVAGRTFIKGGGMNSVIIRDSQLGNVILNKKNKPVRVAFENKSRADEVNINCKSQIELSEETEINKLMLNKGAEGTEIKVKGSVKDLEIMVKDIKINDKAQEMDSKLIIENGVIKKESSETNGSTRESPWTLVMNDEFSGDKIDTSIWTAVNTREVYNNEDEYYTDANTYIENGKLVLEAKKEANGEYSSAKLVTKNKKHWTYGKFEIKAKLPGGQGIWPAIWMLPEDDNIFGGWPSGGEIDITELLGNQPDKIYGTLHYGNPHSSGQGNYVLKNGKFTDDYHVYGIEWEPGEIRWYIDGQLYHTENSWYSRNLNNADSYTYPAPFNRDFYLILNLAVGGDWPGHPDNTTVFPSKMYVDYVKAYELTGRAYREAGERPVNNSNTARLPLEDGNYIYNGGFDQQATGVKGIDNNDGSAEVTNSSYWTFSHVSANTGEAKASNDNGALKVDITKASDVNYGVQFYQKPINLEKGESYKVSFDAWSSENRTMSTKLGSEEDRGWANYSGDQSISLTTSKQTFSYQFKMTGDTNTAARLEFNLGNNGVNTVWLDNVRIEKLPKDLNSSRDALASGNLVYNGGFEEGSKSMEFWKFTTQGSAVATGHVSSDIFKREFVADIASMGTNASSVMLSQDPINLEKGKSYKVTFNARASKNRSIKINLAGLKDDISYSTEKTYDLTTNMKTYSFWFEMTNDTDIKAQLQFNLGDDTGKVYIDDVSVKSFVPANTLFIKAGEASRTVGADIMADGSVSFSSETANISENITVPEDGTYVISYRVATEKNTGWLSAIDIKNKETIPNTNKGWTIVTNHLYLKAGTQNITIYGNDVYLDSFEIAKEIIKDGTMAAASSEWNYWSNTPAASTKSYIDGMENITITNPGSNPWDIGVQQLNISLEKSKLYRLSFDAKSTVNRSMAVALDNFDDTVTYEKYISRNVALTNEMKNYIIDFSMDAASDPNAALTIQLGNVLQSAASEVYLDNIRLVEISNIESGSTQVITAPIITEPEVVIVPSTDNSKYGFEDGTTMGLFVKQIVSNAEVTTAATIVNDSNKAFQGSKALKVYIPNNESEIQVAVNNPEGLSAGQTVTFNVYCPTGTNITGIMPFMLYNNGVADWSWASGDNVLYTDLAGQWKAVTLTIPADHSGTTQKLGLRIYPDSGKAAGEVWIDSIQVQNPAGNLITDGDFKSGVGTWTLSENGGAADPIYVTSGGALAVNVTAVGDANYKPQVARGNISLENSVSYTLTFTAKADNARDVEVVLLDPANNYHYFAGNIYGLTNTEQVFTLTFTADTSTDTSALQFNFGKVSGVSLPTTIYLDDITLVKN